MAQNILMKMLIEASSLKYSKLSCYSFLNDVASVRLGTKVPVHMVKRQTAIQDRKMWSCCKVEGQYNKFGKNMQQM